MTAFLPAPLPVQRAVARLWAKRFTSENEAFGSSEFSQLARDCHAAYGAPNRYIRQSDNAERLNHLEWHKYKLRTAFRNIGAPWYGGIGPDALTAAEIIHFGYEGGLGTRIHLAPLDRAPKRFPTVEVGPWRVSRLSEAEFSDLVKPAGLERHKRGQFDLGKFTQFIWLVVQEPVPLQPAAERDHMASLLSVPLDDFDRIVVHGQRFSEILERVIFGLILHPWEDFAFSGDWRPFIVPWVYTLNNDPFETPRSAPDSTSLSWEPYLTPDGRFIECDHPESTTFSKTSFENFEANVVRTWKLMEGVCPPQPDSLSAFNPFIEHFLLRAYWQEGIDELIMHITAIDAAIGKQQGGTTKAIGKRLKRLLNDEGASQEFERLYNLRSAYIHGRGVDQPLQTSDLISARRLARRAAERVLRYAHEHPSATRDQMLDDLGGNTP